MKREIAKDKGEEQSPKTTRERLADTINFCVTVLKDARFYAFLLASGIVIAGVFVAALALYDSYTNGANTPNQNPSKEVSPTPWVIPVVATPQFPTATLLATITPTLTNTPLPTLTTAPSRTATARPPITSVPPRPATPRSVEATKIPPIDPEHNGLSPLTPLRMKNNQVLSLGANEGRWLQISTPGLKTDATMTILTGTSSQIRTDIYGPDRLNELVTAMKEGAKWPGHTGAFNLLARDPNLLNWAGGTGTATKPFIVWIHNSSPVNPLVLSLKFEGQAGPCATTPRFPHEDNPPRADGSRVIEYTCNRDWNSGNPDRLPQMP